MGHKKLRTDKTCLNCGHHVEERFCPSCGQENTETRETFLSLVMKVIEDITHYEGKFWQSLKYLFFKPGFLTKEYLNGKRKSYLPPIRFYVFASFITFLLPDYLPEVDGKEGPEIQVKEINVGTPKEIDTTDQLSFNSDELILTTHYKTLQELDSTRKALDSTEAKMDAFEYWRCRKAIELRKYKPNELLHLFMEKLEKNFPKSLFIYMPLFALVISLFHKKKNFLYFDHAIFTLHYFSFMLLAWTLVHLFKIGFEWFDYYTRSETTEVSVLIFAILSQLYFVYYFFRAHQVIYHEKSWISHLKAIGIMSITFILFTITFITLFMFTIMMIH